MKEKIAIILIFVNLILTIGKSIIGFITYLVVGLILLGVRF